MVQRTTKIRLNTLTLKWCVLQLFIFDKQRTESSLKIIFALIRDVLNYLRNQ